MITALTQPSADALRSEIRRAKSLLKSDSLTLGVNLTLLPSLVPPDYPAYANVVVEEGIRVVETAGHYKGLEPFVKLFKQHNIRVIHKCTQVRHAQSAASMGTPLCPTCYACTCCGYHHDGVRHYVARLSGVDMISMDGFECAGHPGEADLGNLTLSAIAARQLKVCAPRSRRGTSGTPPPAPGGWCVGRAAQRWTCKPCRCCIAQHRVPVLIMRLSTLSQCIESGDPSAAAFAYGNCPYDDGPYVPSPRVTGGLLDGDRQTEAAAKLWRTQRARRLARATRTVGGQAHSWCAAARLRTG